MNIEKLSLYHFRNFEQVAELEFPDTALLVAAAANATGKTNFLESLVVLLRGKSFRGSLPECTAWGEKELVVTGQVKRDGTSARLSVAYERERHRLKLEENGEPISAVALYTKYPLVTFVPDDTFLFTRGPAARRNFFNHVLTSEPAYLSALVQYQRALRQRNAALKKSTTWEALEPWTEALTREAEVVWKQRQKFTDFLASHMERIYQEATGEKLPLSVRFVPGARQTTEFRQALEEAYPDERRYHYTLVGPHRDDLEIVASGRLVQSVLSRGQMRGLILALKLASWHYLRQTTRETPLLLLDDALSELDEERQARLLTHLPAGQVLLTCTKVPAVVRELSHAQLLDLRKVMQQPAHVPAVV